MNEVKAVEKLFEHVLLERMTSALIDLDRL
jgi:hypothetical protein